MIQEILSENGPLINLWPGFQVRPNQIKLATEIENALLNTQSLILEAPTGTGKTLAYLLPALASQKRIILSVGNRTLQDHLWWGEYQKLRATVEGLRSLTLLKGCENYLCLHRLQQALEEGDPLIAANWATLQNWQVQSNDGEIQTVSIEGVQASQIRQHLTVTADRCMGKACDQFERCYFQKARNKASTAQVLLINHTLLLSDKQLFEKGMGALLPQVDSVIVDEAHQLPELLMRFNMKMVDGYRVMRWIKQVRKEIQQQPILFKEIPSLLKLFEQMWNQIHQQLCQKNSTSDLISVSVASLRPLMDVWEKLLAPLQQMHHAQINLHDVIQRLQGWLSTLKDAKDDSGVVYCEFNQQNLTLFSSHLHAPFTSVNQQATSWVFLSATLMVENNFDYFKQVLSLPDVSTYRCQESLDYKSRAALCMPNTLPLPDDEHFYSAWIEQVIEASEIIPGGFLLLFSSHAALQTAAELLQEKTGRNCLIYQSDSNRQALLNQFKRDGNAFLLATGSFWEGIDIQGLALSCVAIDKLPFIPPNDTMALVWKQVARDKQQNWFNDFMVPHAITRLRQGVGRLLRSHEDCGLILLGDRRLYTKPYGARFLKSLPSMPLLESVQDIRSYVEEWGISV